MKKKHKPSETPRYQVFLRDYTTQALAAQRTVMDCLGPEVERAGLLIAGSMIRGGRWLLFGNGGSSADAQHFAGEMVGRLYKLERRGLPALALTTDSGVLTCVGNDYGFEHVFTRQLEALATKKDVVMGLSTSGKSPNVVAALKLAKKMGCATVGLSGCGGAKMKGLCDVNLVVPSSMTAHIQAAHGLIGHLLCFIVEKELLRRGFIKSRV